MAGQELDDKIESLANKLMRSGEHDLPDIDAARRAARRMLEESEARTYDPAVHDPEDDDVIRRSSGETAATGETGGTRRVSDGE
jgi:hypothetical protein